MTDPDYTETVQGTVAHQPDPAVLADALEDARQENAMLRHRFDVELLRASIAEHRHQRAMAMLRRVHACIGGHLQRGYAAEDWVVLHRDLLEFLESPDNQPKAPR